MNIEFDPAKDVANIEKHGISLQCASDLEWDDAIYWIDLRQQYGEQRTSAIGYIGNRLHFVAFVDRDQARRIISLRKANKREMRRYAET